MVKYKLNLWIYVILIGIFFIGSNSADFWGSVNGGGTCDNGWGPVY